MYRHFEAPDAGTLGYIYNSKPYYNMQTLKSTQRNQVFDVTNLRAFPKSRNCLCIFQMQSTV